MSRSLFFRFRCWNVVQKKATQEELSALQRLLPLLEPAATEAGTSRLCAEQPLERHAAADPGESEEAWPDLSRFTSDAVVPRQMPVESRPAVRRSSTASFFQRAEDEAMALLLAESRAELALEPQEPQDSDQEASAAQANFSTTSRKRPWSCTSTSSAAKSARAPELLALTDAPTCATGLAAEALSAALTSSPLKKVAKTAAFQACSTLVCVLAVGLLWLVLAQAVKASKKKGAASTHKAVALAAGRAQTAGVQLEPSQKKSRPHATAAGTDKLQPAADADYVYRRVQHIWATSQSYVQLVTTSGKKRLLVAVSKTQHAAHAAVLKAFLPEVERLAKTVVDQCSFERVKEALRERRRAELERRCGK